MNNFLYANFIIALWLTAITTFLLGTFVFVKNRDNIVNRIFFFYSFCIAWWSFSEIWGIAAANQLTALIWTRVEQVGVFFIPTLFVHFVFSLLNIKDKKWIIRFSYLVSIIFACLCATPLMIADSLARPTIPYVKRFGTPGIVYHFAILYFVVMAAYGLFKLYSVYRQSTGLEQNRIKYLFLGSFFGYFGGATNFLLVYGINTPFLTPFGTYALPVYVGIMAYAIVRQRLMDIRIFAARLFIFSLVYIPILSIPYVIGYFLKTSWVLPTMMETIFAPGGLFVYLKIQERAERRILQSEYRNASDIRELAGKIVRLDNVNELGKVIINRLEEITKAEDIALYVIDENRMRYSLSYSCGNSEMLKEIDLKDVLVAYLQKKKAPIMLSELKGIQEKTIQMLLENKVVMIMPVLEKTDLLGVLFLGEKPDNRVYSQVETAALDVLAKQVAFSVQIIQFIEEKEEMQRAINEVQRMKEFEYLTSAIGHEIGNGVQAIEVANMVLRRKRDLVEMFKESKPLEEILKKQTDLITKNVKNVRQVSEALRGYVKKGDVGKKEETDLRELIENVIVLLKVRNKSMKEMDILVEGNATIVCGKAALQAVFYNMLNNSYDAIIQEVNHRRSAGDEKGYRGVIKLSISQDNDITSVYFKDNGIGMNEEVKEKIFIPLFTTKSHEEKKDKRLTGGTGIGMFTIQKMLASQGGKLEIVESKEHEGSEFLMKIQKGGKDA